MKKISVALCLALVGASISCSEDFVTQKPIGAYGDAALADAAGVKTALIGAYSLLNGGSNMTIEPMQMLFGSIRGGEAHKGSTSGDQPQMIEVQRFELTNGNSNASSFFTNFYNGVFRSNLVIQAAETATGLSGADKTQITAEARFLRGHNHFMLKRLFKNVPFIDETAIDVRVPNTDDAGNYVNIWPQILADFEFAYNNLAATNADAGRPNKWAARAYMGKVLLYMAAEGNDAAANYGKAKAAFDEVMTSGTTNKGVAYALYTNYHENFDVTKENGTEWVWGVQHSVLDGATNNNANGSQEVQYTGAYVNTGPCLCAGYGFFNPSQWFVNHFRVTATGLPILDDATRNAQGVRSNDNYPTANPNPYVPEQGFIDPRLDWSVGRFGLEYLDFGQFQTSWVRAPEASSVYMSKKQFIRKSESAGFSSGVPNALNIPVIRYADVLLMAAEVEARLNNLPAAMDLVNKIRTRMMATTGPENWPKSGGVNAGNYKVGLYVAGAPFDSQENALQAILMERTLELGLEGHRGYDLVRYGNADGGVTDTQKFNAYLQFEGLLKPYLLGGGPSYIRATDALMPIPNQAISNSFKAGAPTLKQNPGY